jgi:predicted dinucleotide-binding enzyme
MKIGIIGSGFIGGTLARLFVKAGHEVVVSNSRGAASLQGLIKELGPKAQAASGSEPAKNTDVLVLAAHWRMPEALPPPERVAGKIVIDTMNPYNAEGGQMDLGDSSASEETLKRLPGARLVKTFNTLWYKDLAEKGRPDLPVDQRQAMFLAGDDAEAKRVVSTLIADIGFAPIDTGNLREGGRRQQYGSPLYAKHISGSEAQAILKTMVKG